MDYFPSTPTTDALIRTGALVLPKLAGSPTAEVGTWEDGTMAYYVLGTSIFLCIYDRATGWVQVELTP